MSPNTFHQVQYLLAALLSALFATLYMYCPASKSEVLAMLAATALGFVVGKFSNGFGKGTK